MDQQTQPEPRKQRTSIDELLDQLQLTIHCLDDSVPTATENDIVALTLSHSTNQLPPQTDRLAEHLQLILSSLFPEGQQERAYQNIRRGPHGIQALTSYLQTVRTHHAWQDSLDQQILEPHLKRILTLVVERCTRPQTGNPVSIDTNPNLPIADEQHSIGVTDPNPLNYLIEQLENQDNHQPSPPSQSTASKKRNSTTVAHKLQVIDHHNKTKSTQKQTAKRFGLTQSQLSRWLKEEEELREYLLDKGSSSKRQRTGDFPQIEETLLRYYIEARARNCLPPDELLKERTKSFMKLYQIPENLLKVSNGWLLRFKARNNIKSYQLPPPHPAHLGLDTSLDSVREKLRNLTNSYALQDIYTLGEVELFCNLGALTGSLDVDPSQRLRLTYLLCTNADGSDKRTPLVIGRTLEPDTFQAPQGEKPYWYRYSARGRSSSPIFSEWIRKFDREMQRQERKVFLMFDNTRGHLCELESIASTALLPLPESTLRYVQPLLAGIIRTFKSNYRRNLLESHMELSQQEIGQVWAPKKHEQRLALECAHSAWDQVTPTTIRNCFGHSGIISPRLDDGFTTALDQIHSSQFASDLDMEKSLMATQSALIQLQRDLKLPESSQLSIEEFLELESHLDLNYPQVPQVVEDSQASGTSTELTDEELVQESKFLASQLLEEARYRKREENHEPNGADDGVPVFDPSSLTSIESNTTSKELSKTNTRRAIKPRPKRKPASKSVSSPPSVGAVAVDDKTQPETPNGLLSSADLQNQLPVHLQQSSSPSVPAPSLVPLSVQEMIHVLGRLEYSLPFYLSPNNSSSSLVPPLYQPNSAPFMPVDTPQTDFGLAEKQHLDRLLGLALNLPDQPLPAHASQVSATRPAQSGQPADQSSHHTPATHHGISNGGEHQGDLVVGRAADGLRGSEGPQETNTTTTRLFDLDSSILLSHLESTLTRNAFHLAPSSSSAPPPSGSGSGAEPDRGRDMHAHLDQDLGLSRAARDANNPHENADPVTRDGGQSSTHGLLDPRTAENPDPGSGSGTRKSRAGDLRVQLGFIASLKAHLSGLLTTPNTLSS
ncbi:hypothetical protein PtA15_14A163 [Puccinia triticina]|uniref:HTH CENPB-type domain-containing protein n=1 Tax=Puccinia triticina TaxID=208348 RepID=A0ABY7D129_9BASI|nr:uncharacterized protein PtA15_14A163 [Puccinia triticina]WAQ91281.1 hypothetical protein PtA15_14A163 [Puccinia triticina]